MKEIVVDLFTNLYSRFMRLDNEHKGIYNYRRLDDTTSNNIVAFNFYKYIYRKNPQ